MNTPERRLWISLGAVAAVSVVLIELLGIWGGQMAGVSGALAVLMVLSGRPAQRRDFQLLSRRGRVIFLFATIAAFAFILFLGNRGTRNALLVDIGEFVLIGALLLLYALFSKTMDTLWARFSRR
jgi:ABC-type uncharacterized transport system permease subunit